MCSPRMFGLVCPIFSHLTSYSPSHGGCDVAMSVGALGCVNRVWGLSWGRQGSVGGGMGPRSWWCCQGGFIEYTMHSEEHIRITSHNGICWAVDGVCTSFTAQLVISKAVVVVWVLDVAQVVLLEVVATGFAAVVNHDVVCNGGVLGCVVWGWGLCWSTVGSPGSECCRF
jgi:hypothetical protein